MSEELPDCEAKICYTIGWTLNEPGGAGGAEGGSVSADLNATMTSETDGECFEAGQSPTAGFDDIMPTRTGQLAGFPADLKVKVDVINWTIVDGDCEEEEECLAEFQAEVLVENGELDVGAFGGLGTTSSCKGEADEHNESGDFDNTASPGSMYGAVEITNDEDPPLPDGHRKYLVVITNTTCGCKRLMTFKINDDSLNPVKALIGGKTYWLTLSLMAECKECPTEQPE